MEIAATKDEIKIESLSPSENAAQQHSYRVYLQVMDSKFLEEAHVDPLKWGWVLRNGLYHPVYTEQPAAPAYLLKFVRCRCKLSLKSPCSMNCSCKKWTILCCSMWTLRRWRLSKRKSHKEFGGRDLWRKWNHYIGTANQWTGFYIIATLGSIGSMRSRQW